MQIFEQKLYRSTNPALVYNIVRVTRVCGNEVFYVDGFGCYFHSPKERFASLYKILKKKGV